MKLKSIFVVLCVMLIFGSVQSFAKNKKIEQLVWAECDNGDYPFLHYPADYAVKEDFESDTLMRFSIPASPNTDTLFFALQAQALWKWHLDYPYRVVTACVWFRFVSDEIPENIRIYSGKYLARVNQVNNGGNIDYYADREYAHVKIRLNPSHLKDWFIQYTDTGDSVPEDISGPIVENLIKKGFDVEVWVQGEIQGADYILYTPIWMEVTTVTE
jgi:hypothetical protein